MSRDYEKAANVDESVDDDQALSMAFRRFVNNIAGTGEDPDVEVFEATARALDTMDALQERVEDLEEENERLRTRLDKLGDIGEEKTEKEQKIAAIVTYADNGRDDDQDAVSVKPKEIKRLTGVGRRYSYDLVDDMIDGDGEDGTVGPDGYDWAHDPNEIQRYGAVERDASDKAVVIDFAGVHGEAVPVNKFTTTAQGTGVAD